MPSARHQDRPHELARAQRRGRPTPRPFLGAAGIAALQRSAGNQAVLGHLAATLQRVTGPAAPKPTAAPQPSSATASASASQSPTPPPLPPNMPSMEEYHGLVGDGPVPNTTVQMGEMKTSDGRRALYTTGLASCVAVAVLNDFDARARRHGWMGMVHIPGGRAAESAGALQQLLAHAAGGLVLVVHGPQSHGVGRDGEPDTSTTMGQDAFQALRAAAGFFQEYAGTTVRVLPNGDVEDAEEL